MKRLLMQDDLWTARRKKQGFKIPGGWIMPVSEWAVDIARENEWTVMLMPKHSHDPKAARKEARDRAEKFGRRYETEMTIRMVKLMACLYAKRFPDLVMPDRTLRGFDPAQCVHLYIPYRDRTGCAGDPEIRKLLESMAFKARSVPVNSDSGVAA